MESHNKKCSSKKHEEKEAIFYCPECRIYMCNKCDTHHSELFQEHHQYNYIKNINAIFTGFCFEQGHLDKLEYFCKNHNQLCCSACIAKINKNGKGQHKDCNVCIIQDIREEKKNKLKDNIKCLENLSKSLDESIKKLKILFERINKNKEELKLIIQKVFTKLRNALNDREDFLLSQVDIKFDDIYLNENIIKESENLPNKIKSSLEKGKKIETEFDDDKKLNSFIYDCINIENNINQINSIDKKIKNNDCINNDCNIMFYPKEDKIECFLEEIKSFGKIENKNYFEDSNIISPNDDSTFILDQIKMNNKESIKDIKLIYRATRDGDSYDNFFNKCNEKNNIIEFIKTDNNTIFGGFTKKGFIKASNTVFKDDNAFVFSFINKKIYPVKKNKEAIRCCSCCCPQFYKETIYLYHNFLTSTSNFVGKKNNDYYDGFTEDYELNNKKSSFKVTELEIYQIIFE